MVLLHFLVDLSLYVIPKRVSQELAGHRRFCLLSKVNTLNGHGQANQHLSPQRASPYIPTWLAGNIWFTWIPHFDWVDHRVIGHTGNQVLGWSPMRVLFRPRSSHEIQVKATPYIVCYLYIDPKLQEGSKNRLGRCTLSWI